MEGWQASLGSGVVLGVNELVLLAKEACAASPTGLPYHSTALLPWSITLSHSSGQLQHKSVTAQDCEHARLGSHIHFHMFHIEHFAT